MADRILVVEDEEAISELIEMNLTVAGYEVVQVYDGGKVEEVLKQEAGFDLALVDVMLPGRDGFSLMEVLELLVRVEKVLERTGKQRETLEFADIRIVLGEHQVYKAGQEISLKPLEYDLLVLLAKNKNRAFTRDQLLNQVWGNDYLGESRTVDVHIGQLRKKLRLADVIKTIPKIGYRLED